MARIVALERYPIDQLGSAAGRRLIEWCQDERRTRSVFSLPGFLTKEGLAECLGVANASAPHAFYSREVHNPIFSRDDHRSLPAEHPWRHYESKQLSYIANDAIPPESVLQQLFDWPVLKNFVATVLGFEQLYPLADPLGALSVNMLANGDHLGWHFDTNDFIVALPLQTASRGGLYEYCPYIWDRQSPDWQPVSNVLNGDRELVQSVPYEAGSLVVFCGRYSLHRVTAVEGRRTRLVALLAYDRAPGTTLSESIRMHIYGKCS